MQCNWITSAGQLLGKSLSQGNSFHWKFFNVIQHSLIKLATTFCRGSHLHLPPCTPNWCKLGLLFVLGLLVTRLPQIHHFTADEFPMTYIFYPLFFLVFFHSFLFFVYSNFPIYFQFSWFFSYITVWCVGWGYKMKGWRGHLATATATLFSSASLCSSPPTWVSLKNQSVTRIETAQFMKRTIFKALPIHDWFCQTGEQVKLIYFDPNVVFVDKSELLGVL